MIGKLIGNKLKESVMKINNSGVGLVLSLSLPQLTSLFLGQKLRGCQFGVSFEFVKKMNSLIDFDKTVFPK